MPSLPDRRAQTTVDTPSPAHIAPKRAFKRVDTGLTHVEALFKAWPHLARPSAGPLREDLACRGERQPWVADDTRKGHSLAPGSTT